VLWDGKIQLPATRYHRGDWRKIPAKGGAGTNVIHFFEYLKKERLLHNVVICLTDGIVSGWPEQPGTPVLWALTTEVEPPWGQVIKLDMTRM
jgi:predicted metal-dependent peptidase